MQPPRTIRRSTRALADADSAVDWYVRDAGEALAVRFVEALLAAYTHIARHPDSGSPRWAEAVGIPHLRAWPLKGFPYLVFYGVNRDCIDVWRVLHTARDIPRWIAEAQ